jgi:hypothetical protein
VAVNWNMFTPVDVGARFDEGWKEGRAKRDERDLKSALAAYSENPEDPEATSALARLSPQFASQMAAARFKEQADIRAQRRRAAMFADDPATGTPAGVGAGKTNWRAKQRQAIMMGDDDMARSFGSMADDQERTEGKRNDIFARIATQLQNLPDEASRRAALQQAAPALIQYGWTAEELAGVDLSDTGLGARVAMATTPMQQQNQAEVEVKYNPVTGVKEYYDYLGNFVGDQQRPFKRSGGRVYRWDADIPEPAASAAPAITTPDPLAAAPDAMTPSGSPLSPDLARRPPGGAPATAWAPNAAKAGETVRDYLIRRAQEAKDRGDDPVEVDRMLAEMLADIGAQ